MGAWRRGVAVAIVLVAIVGMVAAFSGSSTLVRPISATPTTGVASGPGSLRPIAGAGSSIAKAEPSGAAYAKFGPRSVEETPSVPGPASSGGGPGYICSTAPCPMGIADYGVPASGSDYSYKALADESYWDSGLALGIGTQTGEGGCLDPGAETGVCFTLQQNQVIQGMYSKGQVGEYWVQNIAEVAYDESCSSPCVSGTYSVTWLDNIWNFSYSGGACPTDKNLGKGCIDPKTIVGDQFDSCASTGGAPEFYYCVGPTQYDLSLPFTIDAYTDVGIDHTSKANFVQFYGEIVEGATPIFGQYYDEVKFLDGSAGRGSPTFLVKDALTPFGLPYDFELVFGGPGGGSTNAVATYGDLQSFYCTSVANCGTSVATYHSLKHAWSSGEDTAETISDVYVIPNINARDLASLYYASDDPDAAIW